MTRFKPTCPDPMHQLFAMAGDRLDREMAEEVSPLLAFAVVAVDGFTPAEQAQAAAVLVEAGGANGNALDDPALFWFALLQAEYRRAFGEGP
jgi:hypothetical protein